MKRIVSVALPSWPIESMAGCLEHGRPSSVPYDRDASCSPFALVEAGPRGVRLSAVSWQAGRLGIAAGDALADARAVHPALVTAPATPAADRARLRRLARWLGRYGIARNAYGVLRKSPSGHPVRCYGLWVDITGVAHLYGGEAGLLADLDRRLAGLGLTAGVGLADTFGAAHALGWYQKSAREQIARNIAPSGLTAAAIAPLPADALRIGHDSVTLLRRLGLSTIGSLIDVPRVALERRFRSKNESARVLLRLDQALGVTSEPRRPLLEPPVMRVEAAFPDPLISADGLSAETGVLVARLVERLGQSGLGVRSLQLQLYRSDGSTAQAAVGTSSPSLDARHLMRLLAERIAGLDLGFGADLLVLEARRAEPVARRQLTLTTPAAEGAREAGAGARLVDRLSNRLGEARVTLLAPVASHWPDRSERRVPALKAITTRAHDPRWRPPGRARRPALLLPAPEPIAVMAEVPEGAPLRFTWRRVGHRIVRASGPERIEPEWWREIALGEDRRSRIRDYYRLWDAAGACFWVFRDGRYQAGSDDAAGPRPAWFVHGIFG